MVLAILSVVSVTFTTLFSMSLVVDWRFSVDLPKVSIALRSLFWFSYRVENFSSKAACMPEKSALSVSWMDLIVLSVPFASRFFSSSATLLTTSRTSVRACLICPGGLYLARMWSSRVMIRVKAVLVLGDLTLEVAVGAAGAKVGRVPARGTEEM